MTAIRPMYKAHTTDAQTICEAIGWDFDMHPIKTLRRRGKVFVTGTLLHPEQWRHLKYKLPDTLPDGTEVVLTGYPL